MRVLFVVGEDLHAGLPAPPRCQDGSWAWIVTETSERARAVLDAVAFDAVVLDVRAGRPGAELLGRWPEGASRPALVFVVERDDESTWAGAAEDGADAWLPAGDCVGDAVHRAVFMALAMHRRHRRLLDRVVEGEQRIDRLTASHADLTRRAELDELTGCLNRRGIAARLRVARGEGVQSWQAVLLDLEGFRAINERLGYRVGDATLRRLGAAVQRAARAGDVVGRVGGDEFLILLPDADVAEAQGVAERALVAVRRDEISVVYRPLSASASIVSSGSDADLDGLLERLHPVLRRGRATGARNRVLASPDTRSEGEACSSRLRCRIIADHRRGASVGAVIDASPGQGAARLSPLRSPCFAATVATLPAHSLAVVALPGGGDAPDVDEVLARTVGLRSDLRWAVRARRDELLDADTIAALRRSGVRIALHDADHRSETLHIIERYAPELLFVDTCYTAAVVDDPMCATVLRVLRALADGAGATLVADDVPDSRTASALALLGVPLSVRCASPRVVAGRDAYHEASAAEGA